MHFYRGTYLPAIDEEYSERVGLAEPEPHEQFAAVRKRLGISQSKMARFLGVSRSTYVRYEDRQVSPSVAVEGALRALSSEIEEEVEDSEAEELIAQGISDFLARPRHALLLERRGTEEELEPPITEDEIRHLRKDLLGWTQVEMAEFFRVAQSTANNWELDAQSIQPVVEGALRALQDEIVYRTWTLVHGEWLAFREGLKRAGVAAFIAGRRRDPDWWPELASGQAAR